MPGDAASSSAQVRAVVLVDDQPGADYEPFDVVAVTAAGATLAGPLLLELGEEVALRLRRGDATADVVARVASVERVGGDRGATTALEFVGASAAALAPFVG
jgi:hypothetical protein